MSFVSCALTSQQGGFYQETLTAVLDLDMSELRDFILPSAFHIRF